MGGDEFMVVAQGCGEEAVTGALKTMEEKAGRYNAEEKPPVPLQIAHGFAHYDGGADKLEDAEKLADQRMYEK